MSTENANQTPTVIVTLAEKQENWKNFAVVVHNTEQKLQLNCSKLTLLLRELPTEISHIADAEAAVKRVKADLNEQVELRMTVTSKFTAVAKRLMSNEESVTAAIGPYDAAILDLKKKERSDLQAKQARLDEIARFREKFAVHIANIHAQHETTINAKVLRCFEHCLNENTPADAIPMDKMQAALVEAMFVTEVPASTGRVYLNDDEVFEIWKELKEKQALPPAEYVTKFHNTLATQFNFYSVALKNKEAALELAKTEAAKVAETIATEQADATVAAKLETISVASDAVQRSTGKKIKSVYKLDMEENDNSALVVLTAFASNWNLCRSRVRVKSLFALSISQMGSALEAVKNDDEKFEVSGLKWKTVDKL